MNIVKIIEVLLRRKVIFLLIFDVGLVVLLAWIANKPILYGYVALLDPYEKIQVPLSPGRSAGLPTVNREPSRSRRNTPDENQDLKQYLVFRYGMKGARTDESTPAGAYLTEVKYQTKLNSRYIELQVHGPTLAIARQFLEQVLSNLREEATPQIKGFIAQTKKQISDFKRQIKEKRTQIKEIDISLRTLGFIPNLVQQKEGYRATLVNLKYLVQTLEKSIGPDNISNHQYRSIRPIGKSPVEPNWLKLCGMGIGGLLLFSVYFVLFIDAILSQKSQLKNALVATESPEDALRRRRAANSNWNEPPEDPTMDPQVLYIRGPIRRKRLLNPQNRRRGSG